MEFSESSPNIAYVGMGEPQMRNNVSWGDGVYKTTDGGETWRQTTRFSGVPDMTYIDDVQASAHDADVVYAVLENHKRGDYKPYVFKTDNRGKSWKSIAGNLPERGSAHTITGDHVDPNLLFVGTEFGVFFTVNAGGSWTKLKGGTPNIPYRDLVIQTRENDLVGATFGRSFYVLDDYTPLRTQADDLDASHLFGVRDAWSYVVGDRYGVGEKGFLGAGFYTAPNPPFGAVFTYRLPEGIEAARATRRTRAR